MQDLQPSRPSDPLRGPSLRQQSPHLCELEKVIGLLVLGDGG